VVVVVDVVPIDREPGDLVEAGERFGDARSAEQLGERVRLILVQAEGDLAGIAVFGVGERDQVAVT